MEFVSEGANYRTVVYVNGELAGEHEGGYTPFAIPVHHLLDYGAENTIAVAVDSTPKPERAPGGQFGWWNNGGMYRDVSFRVTDPTYIDDVTVVTQVQGDARAVVRIAATVLSEEAEPVHRTLQVLLLDPSGDAVLLPASARSRPVRVADGGAETELEFTVENARLWSLEQPNLYALRLTLTDADGLPTDEWSHRIGLRTITVEGTRLLLNGEPFIIKGLNRHEQYPGGAIHTPTHTEASLGTDLDLVQWVGANALRCHYPNHRRLYELCDERGILNMVEVPLWQWGRPLVETDHPGALDAAKSQLWEIVRTYKNHACVFFWSVSNENLVAHVRGGGTDDPDALALAKQTADGNIELVQMAKALDPTRPVVEASNEWPGDPVHQHTDVTAVNVYVGGPHPHVSAVPTTVQWAREKIEALRRDVPGKPIIASEFGNWTIRGLHEDYPPGENFQVAKLTGLWNGLMEEPDVAGVFIWIFADSDVHTRFKWVSEFRVAYGLFDMERRPKASAYAMRKLWRE